MIVKVKGLEKCLPIVDAQHSPGKLFLDGALFHFAGDAELTFRLHRTVTCSKLPHVSSPLIHSFLSFDVHQAGGGLPIVKIKK